MFFVLSILKILRLEFHLGTPWTDHYRLMRKLEILEFTDATCHDLVTKRWSSNGSQAQVYQDLRSVFNCNANQLCGTCVLDVMEAGKNPTKPCMEVRWPQGFESSLAWTSLKYWIEIYGMPQKSHLASNVSIKNQTDMKYKHSQHFSFNIPSRGTRRIQNDWSQYNYHQTSPGGQGGDNLTERSLSARAVGCQEVHHWIKVGWVTLKSLYVLFFQMRTHLLQVSTPNTNPFGMWVLLETNTWKDPQSGKHHDLGSTDSR